MTDLFKISRERQEAIDDWLAFPAWAFLFAPSRWENDRMIYTVTRKFCREAGMTPRQIMRAVRGGTIELVPLKTMGSRAGGA